MKLLHKFNSMGLFNSFFTKTQKKPVKINVNWINLTSVNEINQIKILSTSETVFIFKHSTRCGISKMVKKRFENMFDESMSHVKVYYLDLLNYRDISDKVGLTFKVIHQSPQLLIIKNEVSVLNASHQDITSIKLQDYI
jgi:bacillithiol system protein YtxJ